MKRIGTAFFYELKDAGLLGLPFSWSEDGNFTFSEGMNQAQIDAVMVVYESHNPSLPAPEIAVCSPWQIRKALNALGLRQAVEDSVAASSEIALRDGWEFATEFRSDDPFVISIGALLGKSEEETRDLIETAAKM